MSSDAVQEIFLLIEQLETTIKKQNNLIARLINENVEQQNFIDALLREQHRDLKKTHRAERCYFIW